MHDAADMNTEQPTSLRQLVTASGVLLIAIGVSDLLRSVLDTARIAAITPPDKSLSWMLINELRAPLTIALVDNLWGAVLGCFITIIGVRCIYLKDTKGKLSIVLLLYWSYLSVLRIIYVYGLMSLIRVERAVGESRFMAVLTIAKGMVALVVPLVVICLIVYCKKSKR